MNEKKCAFCRKYCKSVNESKKCNNCDEEFKSVLNKITKKYDGGLKGLANR